MCEIRKGNECRVIQTANFCVGGERLVTWSPGGRWAWDDEELSGDRASLCEPFYMVVKARMVV